MQVEQRICWGSEDDSVTVDSFQGALSPEVRADFAAGTLDKVAPNLIATRNGCWRLPCAQQRPMDGVHLRPKRLFVNRACAFDRQDGFEDFRTRLHAKFQAVVFPVSGVRQHAASPIRRPMLRRVRYR